MLCTSVLVVLGLGLSGSVVSVAQSPSPGSGAADAHYCELFLWKTAIGLILDIHTAKLCPPKLVVCPFLRQTETSRVYLFFLVYPGTYLSGLRLQKRPWRPSQVSKAAPLHPQQQLLPVFCSFIFFFFFNKPLIRAKNCDPHVFLAWGYRPI